MSLEDEMQQYINELEKQTELLQEQVVELTEELKKTRRLVAILDTQQQHVDL